MKILFVIVANATAILLILLLIRIEYDRLVKQIWHFLKSEPSNTVFTKEMIADLDEPVQKYFLHAIKLGTPLATHVELKMNGSFRRQPDTNWLLTYSSQFIIHTYTKL